MHRLPLPPGNIRGTHFCWRLSQPQGHSAAGKIMSMKNSIDTIGNQTRDLPTCSAVPQPTALPRAPRHERQRILLNNGTCVGRNCRNAASCNSCHSQWGKECHTPWSQPYIVVCTVCVIGFRCVLTVPFILTGSVTLTCWSSSSSWSR